MSKFVTEKELVALIGTARHARDSGSFWDEDRARESRLLRVYATLWETLRLLKVIREETTLGDRLFSQSTHVIEAWDEAKRFLAAFGEVPK